MVLDSQLVDLKNDIKYQSLRKQFRSIIEFERLPSLSDTVMMELFRTHPEAHWIKFADGVMYAINEQYSKDYGIPLIDYVDKCDICVWKKETSDAFNENDKETLKQGKPCFFMENIELNGEQVVLDVLKWPMSIFIEGQEIKFIAGKVTKKWTKKPKQL